MIAELNERFGSPGLRFVEGEGGLTKAILATNQAEVELYLHGAHVTRFDLNEQPILWMSSQAVFNGQKALRGGIPIVFPWFGAHPTDKDKPQHGFARNNAWEVLGAKDSEEEVQIDLVLESSTQTREFWPHDFRAVFSVTLNLGLQVCLRVENTGTRPFEVSPALHTYFAVDDISQVAIAGFDGSEYIDQLQDGERLRQSGPITFAGEVDRIYLRPDDAGSGKATIHDQAAARTIEVTSGSSHSTVVWNPWIDKAKRMSDFPDEGYQQMVCVETANAASDRRLVEPGEQHELMQRIRLMD